MLRNSRPQVDVDAAGHALTPRARLRQAVLAGTGRAVPSRVLANGDFPESLQTSDEWIRTRTGIRERRIAAPNESTFTLSLEAAQNALSAARLPATAIDLIICTTVTPETLVPSNACRLQGALGCRTVGAFDINGACSGFLIGMTTAQQFIAAGTAKHVLVVGAELLSRTCDYTDRSSCILFGDGAGAVVLSAGDDPAKGIRAAKIGADGLKGDLIFMPSTVTHIDAPLSDEKGGLSRRGHHLTLNGREVFKFAVRSMIGLVGEALASLPEAERGRTWLVPHQVNQRIVEAALPDLGLPAERVVLNLDKYGNTSAASIPIALDEAVRRRMVGPGDHVIMVAFGGGMTWGSMVVSL